jgi:16S rRNA processing protein RimM
VGEKLILMGVVGRPHGVRGLVRVNAFTADPDALAAYPLTDKAGRRFALEWVSGGVAQLSEMSGGGRRAIADRNEAERLVNTGLFVPRSALPAADEEEFYLADLVGLTARNAGGEAVGTIAAVHDYGGGTSLEIAPGAMLVPFTREAVPVVDIAGGHVVIRPPVEVPLVEATVAP